MKKWSSFLVSGFPSISFFHRMLQFRFDLQIEDGEVNGDSNDSNKGASSLNNVVTLPKLFAPFKDKSRGWTAASPFVYQHFGIWKWWNKHNWQIPKGTKQQGQGGSQVLWRLMDLMATRTRPRQVWKRMRMLLKVFSNTLAMTHKSIVNV